MNKEIKYMYICMYIYHSLLSCLHLYSFIHFLICLSISLFITPILKRPCISIRPLRSDRSQTSEVIKRSVFAISTTASKGKCSVDSEHLQLFFPGESYCFWDNKTKFDRHCIIEIVLFSIGKAIICVDYKIRIRLWILHHFFFYISCDVYS